MTLVKNPKTGTKICPKSERDNLNRRRREHYKENHDEKLWQRRVYREKNRDSIRLQSQEYREKNREECLRRQRDYYATIVGHLRSVFNNMGQRCNNPSNKYYKDYGGRGIQNKFKSLGDFRDYIINELKVDPRGLQIDRIDNDGHYEEGNIRFVTAKENCNNRRNSEESPCQIQIL